jgi:hypothetical protein
MLDLSFDYVDQVSEHMVSAYQTERDRWLLTRPPSGAPGSRPCSPSATLTWTPPSQRWAISCVNIISRWRCG